MTDALARYARFYETMSLERLEDLRQIVHRDVHFKDPFNDVRGVERMIAVMRLMYDHGAPRFVVLDRVMGDGVGYLRWRFESTPKGGGAPWIIEGMSEVRFDPAGRVSEHIDHWDAAGQFYAHLPVIGWLIERIARRLRPRS